MPKLRPSSADRWMTCPASVRLSADLVEPPPSPYATEGVEAHEALERSLLSGTIDADPGTELHDALSLAISTLETERQRFEPGHVFLTETKVRPSLAHPELAGTADIIVAGKLIDGGLGLTIADFKYGRNVAVPAGTPQLAIYALGAAQMVGGPIEHFRSMIIQPRVRFGRPIKTHDRGVREMLSFNRQLHDAIAATADPAQEPVAGDHCRWCLAKPTCPAAGERRSESARKQAESDFAAFLSD